MLVRTVVLNVACVVVASVALCSTASADFIVGPGNVVSSTSDTGNPLDVLDTSNPVTLSAGRYKATQFTYEFGAGVAGTVKPFLATSNGDHSYKIVAVGNAIAYDGSALSWQSHTFGGTDTFAGGTLYAGYYWQSNAGGTVYSPIGFASSGSADVWTTTSALAPVKDATTSIAEYVSLGRTYDFSIAVTAVPEPSSIAMLVGLGLGLFAYAWRNCK